MQAAERIRKTKMAATWQGGSYTKICLAAAVAGSLGLALYYGYKKRSRSGDANKAEDSQVIRTLFRIGNCFLPFISVT